MLHAGGGIELTAGGRAQELVVRCCVPERIGEAAGGHIRLPFGARRTLHPEQEARRLQHAFDHGLSAFQEIALGLEDLPVHRDLFGIKGPAECLQPEGSDKLRAASGRIRGGVRARNQVAGIAAQKGAPCQALGSEAIGFDLHRRQGLRTVLIFESIHEIFRGKLARRVGGFAQQIADGVGILSMGKPPQHDLRRFPGVGGFRLSIGHRTRDFSV